MKRPNREWVGTHDEDRLQTLEYKPIVYKGPPLVRIQHKGYPCTRIRTKGGPLRVLLLETSIVAAYNNNLIGFFINLINTILVQYTCLTL